MTKHYILLARLVPLLIAPTLNACSQRNANQSLKPSTRPESASATNGSPKFGALKEIPGKSGLYHPVSEMGGTWDLRGVPSGTVIRSPQSGKLYGVP